LYRDDPATGDAVPHAIGIGRTLRVMLFDQQLKWDQVSSYIACLFEIEDPARPASPGSEFQARK